MEDLAAGMTMSLIIKYLQDNRELRMVMRMRVMMRMRMRIMMRVRMMMRMRMRLRLLEDNVQVP